MKDARTEIDERIEAVVDPAEKEKIRVLLYHVEELESLGFTDNEQIIQIAEHPRCDIYALKDLKKKGCSPELAWEIIR